MGVTHFPNGLSTNSGSGIFADLPSVINPLRLWEALFDFNLKLDVGGADNQWSQFGTSTGGEVYPDEPFGVLQLPPDTGETFGVQQENCQGFDFALGTGLWFRAYAATPDANSQLWVGMTDAEPIGPAFDTYDEACVFHVLGNSQLNLEIWSGGIEVQTINIGTMPRDGSFIELGYHYDGENIFVSVDEEIVAIEAAPVVPDVPLHIVMALRDDGGGNVGNFDYVYNAQLRRV